jgi:hypothetical protein
MTAWTKLKQILNDKKKITENQLKEKLFITNTITNKKFREYLHLLVEIHYIGHWRGYFSKYHSSNIPYYKLIKKIPEKLTIDDAKKIKQIPWLGWFKYPD